MSDRVLIALRRLAELGLLGEDIHVGAEHPNVGTFRANLAAMTADGV